MTNLARLRLFAECVMTAPHAPMPDEPLRAALRLYPVPHDWRILREQTGEFDLG